MDTSTPLETLLDLIVTQFDLNFLGIEPFRGHMKLDIVKGGKIHIIVVKGSIWEEGMTDPYKVIKTLDFHCRRSLGRRKSAPTFN